jgi:hypothetical protein
MAVTASSALLFGQAMPAWAENFYIQNGRVHENVTTNGDGSSVRIDGESYHPDTNSCIAYSTSVSDEPDTHQIETGLLRCGSGAGPVDSNPDCDNTVFVESLYDNGNAITAQCWDHGTITNGTYYDVSVRRNSQSGTDFYPVLFQSQTSYPSEDRTGIGQSPKLWTWAEHTNGNVNTLCSWWGADHANFSNWQHLHIGSGWSYESNSSAGKVWNPDSVNPSYHCWNISDMNGTGDYNVDKPS